MMRLTPSQCIARIVGRVVALRARSEREVTGPWVVAQVGDATRPFILFRGGPACEGPWQQDGVRFEVGDRVRFDA